MFSPKSRLPEYKGKSITEHMDKRNHPSQVDSININSTKEDPYTKWKKEYDTNIEKEKDRLNDGSYDKYRYIEFDVAGIHYRTSLAKEIITSLNILSEIHFIKEPNNPYDKFAVKIVYDRKRIGYVPAYLSQEVSQLINNNQIYKILVLDSGKDITSEYSDALFITIRVYYTPTDEEIRLEKEKSERAERIEREKEEIKSQRLLMPLEHPQWMNDLIEELKSLSVESEEKKWATKRLRDNIRNSLKSYEKAIREEKEIIANNAEKRLMQYRDELHNLLKK